MLRITRISIIVLSAVTILFGLYSLSLMEYPISFSRCLEVIVDHVQGKTYDPSTDYRGWVEDIMVIQQFIPRTVGGLLIGAVLGMAGSIIQIVIRNPIADPYTTGISSGALLGVILSMCFGATLIPIGEDMGLMANALIFAMIPSLAIAFLSIYAKCTSRMIVLIGIGVMMFFSAVCQSLTFISDPMSIKQVYLWNLGSLNFIETGDLPFLFFALAVMLAFCIINHGKLSVMIAGDNMATSLGVDYKKFRIESFMVVSVCTAIAVSFSGAIGFIGLVIPHICKLLFRTTRYSLFASAVVGALILNVSDVVARLIILGGLPVGVITAAIGSPLFLYLLVKSSRQRRL
ncbi:MAG: iron ABC transporter permease [Candidatus Methanomethylophilaceae archaeon]|nr:iron ABC transporter permease [Candidatus Methanomethylophilaceae archaeon]